MVKLVFSRRYPFVLLTDVGLRRQVELLRKENEDLRARLVTAQDEKVAALGQAEDIRKQKERLRLQIVTLKKSAEAQRKVHEVQQAKIHALREEIEAFKL